MAATNSTQRDLEIIGILNYAFLATPFKSKKDDGTFRDVYKTSVLMERNDPQVETIKQAQREIAQAAWGSDPVPWTNPDGTQAMIPEWQAMLLRFDAQGKIALKDGNLSDDENAKGKLFITANFNPNPARGLLRPTIIATLGNPPQNVKLEPGNPFFPYSGCKAAVQVSIYAQGPKGKPHQNGSRINVQLKGVQFLAHGKAFAGGGPRIAQPSEFGIRPADADAAIPGAAQGAADQPNLGAAGGLI
jgi:hypothetical protein